MKELEAVQKSFSEKPVKLFEVKKCDELTEFLCRINLTKKFIMTSHALRECGSSGEDEIKSTIKFKGAKFR